MIGTMRWNVFVGLFGFVLTFVLSMGNNFLTRALLHGAYSFLLLFVVVFALRWILGTMIGLKHVKTPEAAPESESHQINETTPDDSEELNGLLKDRMNRPEPDGSFVPLQPKKLASVQEAEAEQLAQALRHLKDK